MCDTAANQLLQLHSIAAGKCLICKLSNTFPWERANLNLLEKQPFNIYSSTVHCKLAHDNCSELSNDPEWIWLINQFVRIWELIAPPNLVQILPIHSWHRWQCFKHFLQPAQGTNHLHLTCRIVLAFQPTKSSWWPNRLLMREMKKKKQIRNAENNQLVFKKPALTWCTIIHHSYTSALTLISGSLTLARPFLFSTTSTVAPLHKMTKYPEPKVHKLEFFLQGILVVCICFMCKIYKFSHWMNMWRACRNL